MVVVIAATIGEETPNIILVDVSKSENMTNKANNRATTVPIMNVNFVTSYFISMVYIIYINVIILKYIKITFGLSLK